MEKTLEQRISALEAELAKAREEKAAAEAAKPFKAEPFVRFDPTERMGMPASAMRAMVEAVPDFRGIAVEQRVGRSQPGMFPDKPSGEPRARRGSGWVEPKPLEPPPGVSVMDQMLDVEDEIDRRALERRLGVKRKVVAGDGGKDG